jgi:hypothetical protein
VIDLEPVGFRSGFWANSGLLSTLFPQCSQTEACLESEWSALAAFKLTFLNMRLKGFRMRSLEIMDLICFLKSDDTLFRN